MIGKGGCETLEEFELSAVGSAVWAAHQTLRMLTDRTQAWCVYVMVVDHELASMQASRAWAWWKERS